MTTPEASAYANEQSSFGNNTQAALASAPATVVGHGNVQGGSGQSNGSVAAPLSRKMRLCRAVEKANHDEPVNPKRRVSPDRTASHRRRRDCPELRQDGRAGPRLATAEAA